MICDANRMMSCSSGIKNTIREQFHAVIHEEPSQSITRRFRSLRFERTDDAARQDPDAQQRFRTARSAFAGRALAEQNMRSHLIIISDVFRKDSLKGAPR